MKKIIYFFFSCFISIIGIGTCLAVDVTQTSIILWPGFNVVSTPATVNQISLPDGGANVTAFKMIGGQRQQAVISNSNVASIMRPLEGLLFFNSASNPKTMTLQYDKSENSSNIMHSKTLDAGWNLLGVTTEDEPFSNIALSNASMVVDFTNGLASKKVNFNNNFVINPTRFQLGKAYGVFLNQDKGIYGGVNNYIDLNEEQCVTSQDFDNCVAYRNRQCHGNSLSGELLDAYRWAYSKGLITLSLPQSCLHERMTRLEAAKILVKYAENILGLTPDTQASCNYSDLSSLSNEEIGYIIDVCQFGILSRYYGNDFRPYDTITRAEFGIALSRLLWGNEYDGGTPGYVNHFNALKAAGIVDQIGDPIFTDEVLGYAISMLQRSENISEDTDECEDALVKIACSLGSDVCPSSCNQMTVERNIADNDYLYIGEISELDALRFYGYGRDDITSVILQKTGTVNNSGILYVKLQDGSGNTISTNGTLKSDGTVELDILTQYQNIIYNKPISILIKSNTNIISGASIGLAVNQVFTKNNMYTFNNDNISINTYTFQFEDECEDTLIKIACALGDDECPIQCRNIEESDSIKLSNVRLGNIDTIQGAENIVIAEGYIGTTKSIVINDFYITGYSTLTGNILDGMRIEIGGEEYEGALINNNIFRFSNIEISGSTRMQKVKILVDIPDTSELLGNNITFTVLNRYIFNNARYKDSKESVDLYNVNGSISFSKVTIQSAKASLKNNLTKDVEFLYNETNRKVVFDGIYTAKNADIYLNSFYMNGTNPDPATYITYYLSIDGVEVAYTDTYGRGNEETFSEIKVKAGKSVSVKIEAEVEAYGTTSATYDNISLVLGGEDQNGNEIANAQAKLVTMKVKESGLVTISTSTQRNTVLLKASTQTLAKFTVKPSNSEEQLWLDNLTFTITGTTAALNSGDLKVWFDGVEEDASSEATATTGNTIKYEPNTDLGDGIVVVVEIDKEYTGTVVLTVTNVNGKSQNREFSKRYEEALVYVASLENKEDETKFILAVELADSDTVVRNVKFLSNNVVLYSGTVEVVDGDDISILGSSSSAKYVDEIQYEYKLSDSNSRSPVIIKKSDFNDYFKVGSDYIKVYKAAD